MQGTWEGAIADAVNLKGLDVNVNLKVPTLAAMNEISGQDLPDSGPLTLVGNVTSEQALDGPTKISGSLSADGVNAEFSGSLADIASLDGIVLAVNLKADSLQKAGSGGGGNAARRRQGNPGWPDRSGNRHPPGHRPNPSRLEAHDFPPPCPGPAPSGESAASPET